MIRGGARNKAWADYQYALKNRDDDEVILLLVDSESVPKNDDRVWEHLDTGMKGRWKKPATAGDDDAQLMVVCMETWILADRPALEKRFGKHFKEGALTNCPDLERVEKKSIFLALKNATSNRYEKGQTSFELLAEINPLTVEEKCPSAKRLLDRLREL